MNEVLRSNDIILILRDRALTEDLDIEFFVADAGVAVGGSIGACPVYRSRRQSKGAPAGHERHRP